MSEPQILCRMCDNRVNKAVHGLAAILLVRLVGQPPKNVKNEICPYTGVLPFIRELHV